MQNGRYVNDTDSHLICKGRAFSGVDHGALWQYVIVGLTLGFTDLVVMGGYTALAARLLASLKSPASMRALNRVFGSLFVAAGALLAAFKRGV